MNLKRRIGLTLVGMIAAAAGLSGPAARGEDRDLAFIHALQGRGMGDVAIDYLQTLVKQPDCPPAVRDVFDLEMSKALRVESQSIADPTERAAVQAKSQEFLDRFVKQKPNHPEAVQAELASAEMLFEQGKEDWIAGRGLKDKAASAAKMGEARKAYQQSLVVFKQVAAKLAERLAKLPPRPRSKPGVSPPPPTRAEKDAAALRGGLEAGLVRAVGETALVEYFIAQTYPDPADNVKRKFSLSIAAKALDAVYQSHRGDDPNSAAGRAALVAHVWNGKAIEELGDLKTANDIYDEVLENLPEPAESLKEGPSGMEDVLAQAKHFSLLLLEKDPAKAKGYVAEAKQFLADYKKNYRSEWGYQAIEFELAKHQLAAAAKETKPTERAQLLKDGLALLNDMKSVRSEFQNEAILLYFDKAKQQKGVEPKTADEAIALADPELKAHHWAEAEAYYRKALGLLDPKKDAVRIAQVQDAIASCQLQPIYEEWTKWQRDRKDYDAKKFGEWTDRVEKVAREHPKTDAALKAIALGVYLAWSSYVKSDEAARAAPKDKAAAVAKDAAVKRLQGLADYTIKTFAGTPEADEARMSLARMKWIDGQIDEALAAFLAIDPKSEKYSEAIQTIAKILLNRYYQELKKPEAQRNAKQLAEDRAQALKYLAASAKAQQDKLKPGDPIPDGLIETELLLAQVHLDGKDYQQAANLLQPLVDAINKAHPAQLDDTMLKVFGAIVRAYLGLNDFQKAGAAGSVLISLGPDKAPVNAVLLLFVQRLDIERRKLEDQLNLLPVDTPPSVAQALRGRLLSINDMLAKMVSKLTERQELSAKSMYFIGKEFVDVEDYDNAERQFKAFQAKAAADPDFAKEAKPLINLVLTRMIDISRKQGKFEQAAEQVEKLRAQVPHNLDVMITEAQIYQDWGEKKDPKKFDIAVSKWATIRGLLARQKSKYADVYYDALYNSAYCLLLQARKLLPTDRAKAMDKAKEGEKVLNSEMFLNKKLNGPLTVQRFQGLMAQLQAFQGKTAAPADRTTQDR